MDAGTAFDHGRSLAFEQDGAVAFLSRSGHLLILASRAAARPSQLRPERVACLSAVWLPKRCWRGRIWREHSTLDARYERTGEAHGGAACGGHDVRRAFWVKRAG